MEVADFYIEQGYSTQFVLRLANIPRSSYYYHKKAQLRSKLVSEGRPTPGFSRLTNGFTISDEQIKEWLMELIASYGASYGYRKLTVALREQHKLRINKKKVYRLCKELGILKPQRQKRVRFPKRIASNRTITNSNQLFETDIKYGYIAGEQRFFFIQSIIDVYDRAIVSYHIGLRCEAKDVVRTIQAAMFKRQLFSSQTMPVIRSDNGPQFISSTFEEACSDFGMEHERIPPRTPNMNAHIESFHRILQDDCFSRYEFQTYGEAYQVVSEFIRFYNERRIHSSLKDIYIKRERPVILGALLVLPNKLNFRLITLLF
ncbi:IS3 family transposase [Paenibacillus popilliae]|uniref:IS3 family transposase n=1 Tax=Paenibacillus popilliae TaxID=78057 RepID=A0ABY3AN11_PAEPP|nr:IS3 family transposase [Paenibacillus sp. SDF0028]